MAAVHLQFVLGRGLASRAIAWWGQGYDGWSHVDAVLPDGSLLGARSDVIAGIAAGVQIRPAHYERWIRRAVVEIPSSAAEATEWERWLRRQIGRPYDQDAIWGFAAGRRQHARGHWICSACQYGALRHLQWLHPCGLPDSQITPDTLRVLVTAGLGGRLIRGSWA